MFKKVRLLGISLALLTGLLVPVLAPAQPVFAGSSLDAACNGIGLSGARCSDETVAQERVSGVVSTIVNILSWIVGVAAVIMIVVSGFKYIASGGDSNRISSAKNTLVYAIIGLVIVLLAQFIVRFVITRF